MMKLIRIFPALIFGGALTLGSSNIKAQIFGVEYTTEWQTDFKGGYDWLNLLKTSAEIPLYGGLSADASTISTAKTGADALIDDRLTYSNIEAGNIPLTLARLGVTLKVKGAEWFVGINNVNEDYFISDLTSFFTNSSCGISPTISCNYDIANYPMASWCAHYRQAFGSLSVQTSLYPGKGYSRIFGHDNLFSVDFRRDGVFSITSIDYNRHGINFVLGVALHYGVSMDDEAGRQIVSPEPAPKKRFTSAPWLLTEISLPCNLGLLAHGSVATVRNGCKGYAGLGAVYHGGRMEYGLSLNYASFGRDNEYDAELTARIPVVSDKAYIQPALHIVLTGDGVLRSIGMLRFSIAV